MSVVRRRRFRSRIWVTARFKSAATTISSRRTRLLKFDRGAAYGKRLDIPAGTAVRFEPGETKTVKLVEIAGKKVIRGGNNLADGKVSAEGKKAALKRVKQKGFGDACLPTVVRTTKR